MRLNPPTRQSPLLNEQVGWGRWVSGIIAALLLAMAGTEGSSSNAPVRADRGFAYLHVENKEVPWSIHVVRADRARRELAFTTTMGDSNRLGMNLLSAQVKSLPTALGKPLAAINGDFYIDEPELAGDPRDLQIHEGELVSAPNGNACFWIDAAGDPHSTNVLSRLRVVWPDGSETPIGLNQLRANDTAVLYSAAVGPTTPTVGGTELILEHEEGPWLPLQAGRTVRARVREIRRQGATPVDGTTLILSLGSKLPVTATPGMVLQILTETIPDLTGVTTAIGGGPTLVREGKPMAWSGFLLRHPRSAVGWNKDRFFLVEVDGRQGGLSVGMTFPELADYLVKLGCEHAMNLDGGGSATLWVYGQVMNSPSEGQERPGANSLVLVLRKPESEQAGH